MSEHSISTIKFLEDMRDGLTGIIQGMKATLAPPAEVQQQSTDTTFGARPDAEPEAPQDRLVWLNPNANAYKLSFINCAGQMRTVGGAVKEGEMWRGGYKQAPFDPAPSLLEARKQVEAAAFEDLTRAHPGLVIQNPAE